MEYKYKYQGQELQDELGLNWYSFKWRNYDPAIGRFMSIDPLSEKYAYQSHYNFSENRVIDGFELEGLEVVLINPTKSASTEQQKAADKRIESGAKNIPNSSTLITVTGHGSPKGMSNDVRGDKIRTASQLNAVLNRNSDDWKNKESGEGMTVVLYSCRTGSDLKDKDGNSIAPSFAQTVSGSDEFKDVEIIAPDQRVYFTEDGPIGTFESKSQGKDDEYKRDSNGDPKNKEPNKNKPGNWNVYKNGQLIRSYQGDWQPTNNPSLWDQLTKVN
ncbi:RHS repeat-associated core domain-containing protein [Flavobacterium sp.]|uniref:RHS repeat-associated core domain-containing protein n=1 Tax=Flavobacterium sp. TaxID=239 RepID=UPI0025C49542|nr:RHS repeat-associated core domain-containing protein [Flavobacterium sp.]